MRLGSRDAPGRYETKDIEAVRGQRRTQICEGPGVKQIEQQRLEAALAQLCRAGGVAGGREYVNTGGEQTPGKATAQIAAADDQGVC